VLGTGVHLDRVFHNFLQPNKFFPMNNDTFSRFLRIIFEKNWDDLEDEPIIQADISYALCIIDLFQFLRLIYGPP
jgi:hypothetical protein